MKRRRFFWATCLVLAFPLALSLLLGVARGDTGSTGMTTVGPGQRYTENVPAIDIREYGYRPVRMPTPEAPVSRPWQPDFRQAGGSDPNNPYAVIHKAGPTFAPPGAVAHYEVTLANYESVTRTYRLTDTLPAGLEYIIGSAGGLTYDPTTRTLAWQGALGPGNLDYLIEQGPVALPYLDLADFGAANLCDEFLAAGGDCDDVAVTFNLGVNGYTANLYGQVLSQLTLSSNGLLLGEGAPIPSAHGHNQWLPDPAAPGFPLAGLWRDADMTSGGRWHAAIVIGLVEGHAVFYAQWHDAPHANDPNLTARHAIAVVLDGDGYLAGHGFFVYDNISDPAQMVVQGYSIGIEDKLGLRGGTHAYAPC
ncbi:MAG: hypothetical protein ACRDHL_08790, partial [Candidatus Promineifilaceae bacterium]